ncbi:MAG: hypothetical protein K8R85_07490 [Bacteroidetes bacterium]|nr:hypothetical protein [Bacteroidota bacterium]
MDYILMKLIEQRMNDLGYAWPNYRFESVRVKSGIALNAVNVSAYNEYYYLVAKTVPVSLTIVSDSQPFNEGAVYANFNFYQIKEFTGLIKLKALVPIDLEFIRVIPRIKEKR